MADDDVSAIPRERRSTMIHDSHGYAQEVLFSGGTFTTYGDLGAFVFRVMAHGYRLGLEDAEAKARAG